MEKTRVKRGKEYYFININFEVMSDYEYETDVDGLRFDTNNYFVTEEEAESTARKLHAVLKGADVIEMPSDINEWQAKLNDYGSERERDAFDYGFVRAVELFKSKIVK